MILTIYLLIGFVSGYINARKLWIEEYKLIDCLLFWGLVTLIWPAFIIFLGVIWVSDLFDSDKIGRKLFGGR